MKASIITSAITTILINLLSGWVIFLVVWIALGFMAKKLVDKHSHPETFKYWPCFILPPLVFLCLFTSDGVSFKDIFGDYFPKFPKFQNPFVWPEKSE